MELFLKVFSLLLYHFFKGLQVSCNKWNVLVQAKWLKQSFYTGGLDIKAQEAALRMKPDIVIATPGRLIDHLHNSPNFSLRNIEILVLDEADRYDINCFIYFFYFLCILHFQHNSELAYFRWELKCFWQNASFQTTYRYMNIEVLECCHAIHYFKWNTVQNHFKEVAVNFFSDQNVGWVLCWADERDHSSVCPDQTDHAVLRHNVRGRAGPSLGVAETASQNLRQPEYRRSPGAQAGVYQDTA